MSAKHYRCSIPAAVASSFVGSFVVASVVPSLAAFDAGPELVRNGGPPEKASNYVGYPVK